jgi:hypothetical protein
MIVTDIQRMTTTLATTTTTITFNLVPEKTIHRWYVREGGITVVFHFFLRIFFVIDCSVAACAGEQNSLMSISQCERERAVAASYHSTEVRSVPRPTGDKLTRYGHITPTTYTRKPKQKKITTR